MSSWRPGHPSLDEVEEVLIRTRRCPTGRSPTGTPGPWGAHRAHHGRHPPGCRVCDDPFVAAFSRVLLTGIRTPAETDTADSSGRPSWGRASCCAGPSTGAPATLCAIVRTFGASARASCYAVCAVAAFQTVRSVLSAVQGTSEGSARSSLAPPRPLRPGRREAFVALSGDQCCARPRPRVREPCVVRSRPVTTSRERPRHSAHSAHSAARAAMSHRRETAGLRADSKHVALLPMCLGSTTQNRLLGLKMPTQ